ncbi:hypothetical protein A4G99_20835 [Haladaptatus sp. R4]|uniref:hypothetical protein n=1 Tax=Haladaptatus sp. R4 TaxID=1679489 RepID=UPI0007B4BA09|nr:hypothetical protein [Haladaptatus sp. R4]KZN26491.1 hypothetical protein A4G99_20835 [Haladaptatus sp. R4]
MATVSELWGRSEGRNRHWWVFVGGYAGIVLALLLVVTLGSGSTLADTLLPVALFYAPPFVSGASAFRGGGYLASLAVGLTPGVLYAIVVGAHVLVGQPTTARAPLWALAVGFGIIGIVGSLLGYGIGTGVLRFVRGRELR